MDVMRLRFRNKTMPYPLITVQGRLKLAGLSYLEAEQVIEKLQNRISREESGSTQEEVDEVLCSILDEDPKLERHVEDFNILTRYERTHREDSETPPFVLAIEGSSATGKSMIGIEMIAALTATRVVSTDSVRQLLRATLRRQEYPELYCHTYQAYKFKQMGPKEETEVVRGFLAQCDLITPHIIHAVRRIIEEGTNSVVEGVHLVPGTLQVLGESVLEILIDPDLATHESMFKAKHCTSGLKTVTDNEEIREEEFRKAREIQKYMLKAARNASIMVIELVSYEEAFDIIRKAIIKKMEQVLEDHIE